MDNGISIKISFIQAALALTTVTAGAVGVLISPVANHFSVDVGLLGAGFSHMLVGAGTAMGWAAGCLSMYLGVKALNAIRQTQLIGDRYGYRDLVSTTVAACLVVGAGLAGAVGCYKEASHLLTRPSPKSDKPTIQKVPCVPQAGCTPDLHGRILPQLIA
jgi:hypothetical protein